MIVRGCSQSSRLSWGKGQGADDEGMCVELVAELAGFDVKDADGAVGGACGHKGAVAAERDGHDHAGFGLVPLDGADCHFALAGLDGPEVDLGVLAGGGQEGAARGKGGGPGLDHVGVDLVDTGGSVDIPDAEVAVEAGRGGAVACWTEGEGDDAEGVCALDLGHLGQARTLVGIGGARRGEAPEAEGAVHPAGEKVAAVGGVGGG
mmetsp:Transcript_48340/g.118325  ORF Transcript_48340/g.118325 Transcript_48340/m.118325 type:complete len:206 (+) Transcript_48340:876-1493(+)